MAKFVKKPIVVEAARWLRQGDHPKDDCFRPYEDTGKIPAEAREGKIVRHYRKPDDEPIDKPCKECGKSMFIHGWIDTLEGGHNVCPGDWIITGIKGEYYPCKNDIFLKTYEPYVDQIVEPLKLYAIAAKDNRVCLYTIDDSEFKVWFNFFKVHPNQPCMADAINAYKSVGYKCIQITIGSQNIKVIRPYNDKEHVCSKCGDYYEGD